MKIIIIECGKQKEIKELIPKEGIFAKDLYISPYYKTNKKYAEKYYNNRYYNKWLIFSTKYGFISHDTKIHYYETPPSNLFNDELFKEKCIEQVKSMDLNSEDEICILAGDYDLKIIKPIFNQLKLKIITPLVNINDYNLRIDKVNKALEDNKPFL